MVLDIVDMVCLQFVSTISLGPIVDIVDMVKA